MRAIIYQDQTIIGVANLEHLDPPMAVAFGPFTPSPQYRSGEHANTIEGEYVGDKGISLTAYSDAYGWLKLTSIAIEDWPDPEFGQRLTAIFQDAEGFAFIFSAHEDYRAYWR